MDIASTIDHTILKPDCNLKDIKEVCAEAIKHQFCAVCIPPHYVRDAARLLEDTKVKVCTVIGFPMGYSPIVAKVEEIKRAIDEGAEELDVVVNNCAVKDGNWNHVKNDIESVTMATHLKGKVIKIIFETALLNNDEIEKLCNICNEIGVDFVKTSTGFSGSGATEEVVRFMKSKLSAKIKIKASGGIRTLKKAQAMVDAGAHRIGASSGIAILQELNK